jgi:hypothetical protein
VTAKKVGHGKARLSQAVPLNIQIPKLRGVILMVI